MMEINRKKKQKPLTVEEFSPHKFQLRISLPIRTQKIKPWCDVLSMRSRFQNSCPLVGFPHQKVLLYLFRKVIPKNKSKAKSHTRETKQKEMNSLQRPTFTPRSLSLPRFLIHTARRRGRDRKRESAGEKRDRCGPAILLLLNSVRCHIKSLSIKIPTPYHLPQISQIKEPKRREREKALTFLSPLLIL